MGSRKNIKGKLVVALWYLLILTVLPAQAAQELPAITPDTAALNAPGKIAVGPDGTIYVVDGSRNRVAKFSANGQSLGDIPLPGVSSIAAAPNGTLYMGSHRDYSVSIWSNGRIIGRLGIGANEFLSIRDIAVDGSTGRVYVADAAGNEVKVYSASGKNLGRIIPLHLPVSVAAASGKIYVLDAPEIQDPIATGTRMTTTSRISIFDSRYSPVGTIDTSGDFDITFRPTDLAVSSKSMLYVSDIAAGSVLLFDAAGTFKGEIVSEAGNFSPVSLGFSPDGAILYVSSNETRNIHQFNVAEVQ
jgi:DNA-binding beta-propeller fold protein YncE